MSLASRRVSLGSFNHQCDLAWPYSHVSNRYSRNIPGMTPLLRPPGIVENLHLCQAVVAGSEASRETSHLFPRDSWFSEIGTRSNCSLTFLHLCSSKDPENPRPLRCARFDQLLGNRFTWHVQRVDAESQESLASRLTRRRWVFGELD